MLNMNRQPPGVHPTLTSTQPKDAPSCFWPRIAILILLIASIALKCTLIVLMFSASQVPSEGIKARKEIQSCLQNCIPCGSAKGHITANLTLNPSTAHPQLYVSSDLKSVRWRGMNQQVNSSLLRYDVMASVLSHESFNSGKLCWEVEVLEGGEWNCLLLLHTCCNVLGNGSDSHGLQQNHKGFISPSKHL
ncbi:butyrophilin subfamily 1 member A1-like [Crotalus tigris]|uniref:butyrophilin subfamily 1 member A1-like n=1 Tax=Crotalus tigris TaxID=88082 RepID=UPI00192F3D66|nr:butyrophilin subfamily 1 member A1-like [Crotalus tigris]